MSVGLLLITHAGVGEALLKVATATFPDHPLRVGCLDVGASADPDVIRKNSERMIAELDSGDGVLILTDAYGSTPSNIACALRYKHRTAVVAGLNLPMLLRVLNYPHLSLRELASKALSGGRDGVMQAFCD
ncbi:MAG: PTS fructose transporter subunit IIA [Xanthomonadaceae bacterium]|nr:PTS fructose transporter subunit IIA [Xanthomonadaceae bacterium]